MTLINKRNNKCRVLFLLPSLERGGAEMQVVNLLREINQDEFEVYLLTLEDKNDLKTKLDGYQIKHYPFKRRCKYDFSMVTKIGKLIDGKNIDVIHCTLQIALLMGWLGRRISKRKPPIVAALHKTVSKNKKDDFLEKYIYQWPLRFCCKVICVCKNQEEFWHKRFPFLKNKTVVIYNGVDTELFDPTLFLTDRNELRRKFGIPSGASVISCIAGLRPEKNHIGLIKAFAKLDIKKLDPYILLAGDGPEKENIEKTVKKYCLEDRVIFLGSVQDVRPVLSASDVTALASTSETFSIAMLESMSMGCPVITTDIGGHKEAIVPGKTGEIVPIGQTNFLADVFTRCLREKSILKSMGDEARKKVITEFSLRKMVVETEETIKIVKRN